MNMPAREPILEDPEEDRFSFFPVPREHVTSVDFYHKAQATMWAVGEVDLGGDVPGIEAMRQKERGVLRFLTHALAFFHASDGIINENLVLNFCQEVKPMALRAFYTFQMAIETVHSEMYALLLDTYVNDPTNKLNILRAIHTIPCIRRKADWAMKWFDRERYSFATRILAFAAVEGIFFSGSFCAIFYLKSCKYNLPGLFMSNEFISRDETLHCDFACHVYRDLLQHKIDTETVHAIIREAVDIESEFMRDALPVALIGMNADLMVQYIQLIADRLLASIGHPILYRATLPTQLSFMDQMSLPGKNNFFEKRVSEYAKAGIGASALDQEIRFDETF